MVKIKLEKWTEAIKNSRGIITLIAERLGVTRQTVYNYIEKSNNAKIIYDNECERPYDVAESKLHEAMTEKESWAIKTMLLEHKRGRARGYGAVQGIELSGSDKPLKLELEIKYGKDTDEG